MLIQIYAFFNLMWNVCDHRKYDVIVENLHNRQKRPPAFLCGLKNLDFFLMKFCAVCGSDEKLQSSKST